LAGRGGYRCGTTLEGSDAVLEDADCRVADTAVDVACLLEAKEAGAVGRIVEDIALGLLSA
jgi:hypothetical protein